jgi:NAD(P)-dependent dehydrogenase (short-subunit alcohol dehydrogenase family)
MSVTDKAVLVTGASRGLGRALVEEALTRGAARVYAGMRAPVAHPDPRVTALTLDVTSPGQIEAAAGRVESLDILVNNAGVFFFDGLDDRSALEQHLAVNLYGPYDVTRAFLPALIRSKGAIVNVTSIAALAPIPLTPAYSLSKAASFNLTQAMRMLLAGQGVRVHAALCGPIDTDMVRDLDIPKTPAESVAKAILDGVDEGEEDIFPDPFTQALAGGWETGPARALERQNAALLAAASPVS